MADDLTTLPDLDLGDLSSLDDLGVEWEYPPIPDPPDLGVPDLDEMTLADLAQRYAPEDGLASPSGKGRRPPRWDDPRILTMLGHLELGAHRGEAITAAGLSERTVMSWLEKGRAEESRGEGGLPTFYLHILRSVLRAETVPVSRALETISRAMTRSNGRGWRAAAWFLERRYPDQWGPRGTAWYREREAERRSREEWRAVSVEELNAKIMALAADLENPPGDSPTA